MPGSCSSPDLLDPSQAKPSHEDSLAAEFAQLNPDQLKAVQALVGPVLVVAGPGTGKTQLLGLRAVNILKNRDVSAQNILCLTFTEAGAEAMTNRLSRFIGSAAYEVTISTFHSFASGLRARYPEYFTRGSLDNLITDLQASQLINDSLRDLPNGNPLYQPSRDGVHGALQATRTFITQIKRSGLSPREFRTLIEQNIACIDYLSKETEILARMALPLNSGSFSDRCKALDELQELVCQIPALLPPSLTQQLVTTPGIYMPFAVFLAEQFATTELYDSDNKKTAGFQELRKRLFAQDEQKRWVFKAAKSCQKSLSAIDVYEHYQDSLLNSNLYDYDDMILQAIDALQSSAELRNNLREQYRYIQVDEYQDTNGVQMRLLDLLTGYADGLDQASGFAPNILVVGDDDQAIMRFQGASVTYINQFEQHYPKVTRCVLKTNYRSTPSVVELGQYVARQIETRSVASKTEKDLHAHRTEQQQTIFGMRCHPSKELQYFAVAQAISEAVEAGFIANSSKPSEAIAVIAPKHASLRGMIPYLKQLGIAFSYTYTTAVSQIVSLQNLLALLSLIAEYAQAREGHGEARMPQVLAAPELGLVAEDYLGVALRAKREKISWLDALAGSENLPLRKLHEWFIELIASAAASSVRQVIHKAAAPFLAYYQADKVRELAFVELNYGLKALLEFAEGELANATASPLRLCDLISKLAEADRFEIKIDVSLPLARENAVTLTTAHSSKGLEFDRVYLIDADDASWHPADKGGALLPQNLLFGNQRDEDDARRLLFVAVTRARFELEASHGAKGTVRELLAAVEEETVKPELARLVVQAEQCWQDNYRLDSAELQALLAPDLGQLKMSASRLNAFVEYREGGISGAEFVATNLLSLPSEPSVALEFGILVHSFLEDYLNHIVSREDRQIEQLVAQCHQAIARLDFELPELKHLHQRFDLIVEHFLPKFANYLDGKPLTERWVSAELEGIPLVGKCDLMVLNEAEKTICYFDYKTSQRSPDKPSSAYLRQLQFYRLLVESSSEFNGYRLTQSADLFVEPLRDKNYQLLEPQFFSTSDAQVARLRLLIQAVWQRIQTSQFDTTGFEASAHKAQALASSLNKDGTPSKRPDKQGLQAAFEQWLIDEWQAEL